ncbi:alginate lyase family protein [Paraburkholderia elongata]|uniref:Alginate lyase n=1 Tax=Paraburkholderia elongata TaxID=2675747 RepID=A0A972SIQ4_9BURK|nr:alginate lyase family protein [Paraburkholderia elongata]NPT57193.1 alginate lyase [Paraburkholderia elongata]
MQRKIDAAEHVSARRRRLMGGVATIPALLLMAALPRAARAQAQSGEAISMAGTFALSSPARAAQIRQSVAPALANQLKSLADEGLAREPHVQAVVHIQGLLPHEQNRDASVLAQEDWRQTLTQALAGCITGDSAYEAKAAAYIDAWMAGYSPSFNPIDEADLTDLLFGFDFLQTRLSPSTVEKARLLGRQLATGYLGERRVGDPSTGLNNWQSHRIKLATAGAYLSGDAEVIAAARAGFVAHATRNVGMDGRTYDFDQRDAMHYVVYDLEPLLMAASMAAAHGEDWYGLPSLQGRLAAALHWLEPYAAGDEQHEEFVHSTVHFDARRAAAHVEGYSGLWKRKEASDLCWIASRLDSRFTRIATALDAQPAVRALFA